MATTILSRLEEHARRQPEVPAYHWKVEGSWHSASWREYRDQVRRVGRALAALGVEPGGHVGILAFNRPEWVLGALGVIAAGGSPAGIYTSSAPNQVAYILRHAECRVAMVENAEQLAKLDGLRGELPDLRWIVVMEGAAEGDPSVLGWQAFLAHADAVGDDELDRRSAGLEREQIATLIYTSGTTGPPKAVMLSHANILETARIGSAMAGFASGDSVLSYLPLAHVAEQMLTLYIPVYNGYQVFFAESTERVPENLREVQPTIVFGVPRVWERIYEAVSAKLALTHGLKRRLFDWASDVGRRATDVHNRGDRLGPWLALERRLAERLVFTKAKERLGLARARFCVSGAAPIAPAVLEFFAGLDVVIYEVYGQSETCGPTTWNRPGRTRFGTVGPALPEVEVRLAEDGEVLVRGPNVFPGYLKDPAATAESFDDGWLRSGDLGRFDAEGFLTITGRKKEIFITSGGKNIAPNNLESALKQIALVSEAVVIGDGRKFLSALLTLEPQALARLAKEQGLGASELHRHPEVIAEVQRGVDAVNARLARVEQIRKFRLLPRNFSIETGELTPTLKIKRRVIDERYATEIEAMYASTAAD